ncbi:MAG: hypothetical protein AAF321_06655 [Pseudomonadota bacterium]
MDQAKDRAMGGVRARAGLAGLMERPAGTGRAMVVRAIHLAGHEESCGQAFNAPEFCPVGALRSVGLHDCASALGHHTGLAARIFTSGSKPLVWVQDGSARRRLGSLGARGLAQTGLCPDRLVHVAAPRVRDALWAMEEAVRAGLDVVGEIDGAPKALDFTATRRLALFSQASQARCLLVRTGPDAASGGATGAPWRWSVAPAPSTSDPYDAHAPGAPCWDLDLVRARIRPPGRWRVAAQDGADDDEAPDRLRVVPTLAARDVAAREGAGTGLVIPFRPSRAA